MRPFSGAVSLAVLSVFLFSLLSCGGSKNDKQNHPSDDAATRQKIEAVIGEAGGTLELVNAVAIDVPRGAFEGDATIALYTSDLPPTLESFTLISEIQGVEGRVPYDIRINSGSDLVTSLPIQATIKIPESFLDHIPAAAEMLAYSQVDIETGVNGFQQIYSLFDRESGLLKLAIPPEDFSQNNSTDGGYEAVIVIGYINTESGAVNREAEPKSSHASRVNDQIGLPLLSPAITADYISSSPRHYILGKYNLDRNTGRIHRGVDLRGAVGDSVLAVAGGKAHVYPEQYSASNPNWGWGKYVVIVHEDKSATLYAHLSEINVENGQAVLRGQRIGAIGVSGNPTPENVHLHFEYIPNYKGVSSTLSGRQDPVPVMGKHLIGLAYSSSSDGQDSTTVYDIDTETGAASPLFSTPDFNPAFFYDRQAGNIYLKGVGVDDQGQPFGILYRYDIDDRAAGVTRIAHRLEDFFVDEFFVNSEGAVLGVSAGKVLRLDPITSNVSVLFDFGSIGIDNYSQRISGEKASINNQYDVLQVVALITDELTGTSTPRMYVLDSLSGSLINQTGLAFDPSDMWVEFVGSYKDQGVLLYEDNPWMFGFLSNTFGNVYPLFEVRLNADNKLFGALPIGKRLYVSWDGLFAKPPSGCCNFGVYDFERGRWITNTKSTLPWTIRELTPY